MSSNMTIVNVPVILKTLGHILTASQKIRLMNQYYDYSQAKLASEQQAYLHR